MKKAISLFLLFMLCVSLSAQTVDTKLSASEADKVWVLSLVKQELNCLEKQYDFNYISKKRDCIADIVNTRQGDYKETYNTYFSFIDGSDKGSYYYYNRELLGFLKLQNEKLAKNYYMIDENDNSYIEQLKELEYYPLFEARNNSPWKSVPYLDRAIEKYISLISGNTDISSDEISWLISRLEPKSMPPLDDDGAMLSMSKNLLTDEAVFQMVMYPLERKYNRDKIQEIDECLYLEGIYQNSAYDGLCDTYHKFYKTYYTYNNELKSLLQKAKTSSRSETKQMLEASEYYKIYKNRANGSEGSIPYLDDVMSDLEYMVVHKGVFTEANIDMLIQLVTPSEERNRPYEKNLRVFDVPKSVATENNKSEVKEVEYDSSLSVDLGLSVRWATCNLGATSPEQFGDYFAWGELGPKQLYNKDNYQFYEVNIGKDISGSEHDVATQKLGANWHTPTQKEIEELKNNCKTEWTNVNNVYGMRFTGPNGNSIFLPAAGYCSPAQHDVSNRGQYWSSTMSNISTAYILNIMPRGASYDSQSRMQGLTIRPVCK